MNKTKEVKELTFGSALLVIGIVVGCILLGALGLKSGIVTTFFIVATAIFIVALVLGYTYDEIEKAGFDYVRKGLQPFFIMLSVGAMVAMWISSGTISTLIYYGLKFISPQIFLLTTMLLCSITSLATGTSWGTMATAGVAMMGVGESMGIPSPIVAGAVICGAYFGDKMSPFSDTTNITAAVTHTPLMTHVRHMMYEQVPSYLVVLVIFMVMGFKYSGNQLNAENINQIMGVLADNFKIGIIPLLPAIAVVLLLLLQTPALLSLIGGAIAGGIVSAFYQNTPVRQLATFFQKGFSIETGSEIVDKILNRGGLASMYDLATLILLAMFISGILSHIGAMNAVIQPVIKKVRGVGSLVLVTMLLTYFLNAVAGSFSLSAVMAAAFMLPLYDHYKLRSENLSRAIEASGTYGGVLMPWNGHALYASATLGVATISYLPYCFLNFLTPLVTLAYAFTGFSMTKYTDEEMEEIRQKRNC